MEYDEDPMPGSNAQEQEAQEFPEVTLSARISPEWSWSTSHAKIPQVFDVYVSCSAPVSHARVTVSLSEGDKEIGSKTLLEGSLERMEMSLGHALVPLAADVMATLDERRSAACIVRVEIQLPDQKWHTAASHSEQVDLLPRDLYFWNGAPFLQQREQERLQERTRELQRLQMSLDAATDQERVSELRTQMKNLQQTRPANLTRIARSVMASFIRPNQPIVAEIAREAASLKGKAVGDPGFHAFQNDDAAVAKQAVEDTVTAVYQAIRDRDIVYSEPPPQWDYEDTGQRIREHDAVAGGGLGTCLDTTVLMSAVLEHVGLFPLTVSVPGHIYVGYWRYNPATAPEWYPDSPVIDDIGTISHLLETGRIGVIETTTATAGYNVSAREARLIARRKTQEALQTQGDMRGLINVLAARNAGISPLPAVHNRPDGKIEITIYEPNVGPRTQVVGSEEPSDKGKRQVDTHPPRYRTWKDALMGGSSALLNLRSNTNTQPIVLPGSALGRLEDLLNLDREFELRSGFDLPDIYHAQDQPNAEHLEPEEQTKYLDKGILFLQRHKASRQGTQTYIGETTFRSEIRAMARRAREAQDERGMNPLFLAIGMLNYRPEKTKPTRDAPIILVPVRVIERFRTKRPILTIDTSSQAVPNYALIEWLKREHQMEIPDLVEPQSDKAGLDVDGILSAVRKSIQDQGVDLTVKAEARLCMLDLAAFRMWKDLDTHADTFLKNPLVHHLVHNPTGRFEEPSGIDESETTDLESLSVPVPADATQLEAVNWAKRGRTFVLQGPPGTGKSQTITNMIATCVSNGMSVLFVAEKQTALAVVERRLDSIGLKPYALNLHHEGSTATQVRAQLKASLQAAVVEDSFAMENAQLHLRKAHFELHRYPGHLHEQNAADFSAYSSHDLLLLLGDGPTVEVPRELVKRDFDRLAIARDALAGLQHKTADLGRLVDYPWRLAGSQPVENLQIDDITSSIAAIQSCLDWADSLSGDIGRAIESVEQPRQLDDLGLALNPTLPSGPTLAQVLSPSWLAKSSTTITVCEESLNGWRPKLDGLPPQVLELNLKEIHDQLEAAETGNVFSRGSRSKRAIAPLAQFSPSDQPLTPQLVRERIDGLLQLQDVDRSVRASLTAIPGLVLPADLTPFATDGLDVVWARLETMDTAARPLRVESPWLDQVRALATAGVLLDHEDGIRRLIRAWNDFGRLLALRDEDVTAWRNDRSLMGAARQHAPAWREDAKYDRLLALQRWVGLTNHVDPLTAVGLSHVKDDILAGRLSGEVAEDALIRGIAQASQSERIRTTGLDHFDSVAHDKRVVDYATAEGDVRTQWVTSGPAQVLEQRAAPDNRSKGRDAISLSKELNKNSKRLSTRALLRRFGSVVQNVCPVVLTSPAATVDFIKPGSMHFDVAIFDEASQITVPEAIGTMGRANAVIVVGDSRQMPPSRRLGVATPRDENEWLSEDDEDEEEEILEDQESILSECDQSDMTQLQLRWHYRSQDEALIAFSNGTYYENELSSFPTPTLYSSETGVEFRKVDGQYLRVGSSPVKLSKHVTAGKNTNPTEALAIVKAVNEIVEAHPQNRPSMGIVTFNQQQRDLIANLLHDSDNPQIQDVMEKDAMGASDVLFVKSLEEVQGDERDTILFSVAFSKKDSLAKGGQSSSQQKVPLNFGRLSVSGGERRLNVAITRARRKNIVICSFEPHELPAEKSAFKGVKDLRAYLEYAQTATDSPDEVTRKLEVHPIADRHRDDIAAALREAGLHVISDVGLSDFRLDLVLSRPETPDTPILPVLLDGESWMKRKTVSDRDVLPVQVLTNLMGWPKVVRVWWPMWLQNRQLVIDGLLTAMDEAEASLQPDEGPDQDEQQTSTTSDQPPSAADESLTRGSATHPSTDSDPHPGRPTDPSSGDMDSNPQPPEQAGDQPPGENETIDRSKQEVPSKPLDVRPPSRFKMAPYVAWDGTAPPIDQALPYEIDALLLDIVAVEGPMHADLAYRRYVKASEATRLGTVIKRALNKATARLVRQGKLQQISDDLPGQITKTLFVPGGDPVVVREIGVRSLEDVPRSEVLALLHILGFELDDPEVKRHILPAYERSQLTKAADRYLSSCLEYTWDDQSDKLREVPI